MASARKQMPNTAFTQRCFLLKVAVPELLNVTSPARHGACVSAVELDRGDESIDTHESRVEGLHDWFLYHNPSRWCTYLACAVAPAGLVWNDAGAASAMVPVPWPCPDSALK